MNIKTLLIDDEPIAIKSLKSLLEKHCPEIDIVGTASNEEDAIQAILTQKPDLVFLDIELGGSSGFDLLKKCAMISFEVIFVTAHNQFGIEAVKSHALDYLLKPLNVSELLLAVTNAIQTIEKKKPDAGKLRTKKNRLSLATLEGMIFVDTDDIMYAESEGRYTRFHLKDNTKHLVSKNLGEYEQMPSMQGFSRIHNSYLVNLDYIQKYVRGRGGYVILKNGQSLEVSSRKKDDFLDQLD
jgi:two-component system LytT family response regulator